MAKQRRLPGVDWHKGDIRREETLAQGARSYARGQGLPFRPGNVSAVRAEPNVLHAVGGIVAKQQGAAPVHISPQMEQSYAALHEHIGRQYEHLTKPTSEGGLGITHEVTAGDPYRGIGEAMADVRQNRRLKTLATDTTQSGKGRPGSPAQENPMMPPDINDKFRAVHDAFGHLATGRDFGRHGETAAFQHHAAMFPTEAHYALASELRGQNSALIRMGNFPENKPYALPDWATKPVAKLPNAPKRKPEGEQLRLF